MTGIKPETAEAIVRTTRGAPRGLLPLLRAYGTTGVITSRCYTADQVIVLAELRTAYPEAELHVNHDLKTVTLAFTVQDVPLMWVFELREVESLVDNQPKVPEAAE